MPILPVSYPDKLSINLVKNAQLDMKKLLYLLLVLPFALAFSSCSNDDDLPDVNVNISFDNVVAKEGAIYVVETDTVKITNIETRAVDTNQPAVLANMRFYWNYVSAPALTWSNFPIKIPMEDMPLVSKGANVLGINATVLQVDKTMAYASIRIPIVAVEKVEDLPDGQQPGTAVLNLRIGQSKNDK